MERNSLKTNPEFLLILLISTVCFVSIQSNSGSGSGGCFLNKECKLPFIRQITELSELELTYCPVTCSNVSLL